MSRIRLDKYLSHIGFGTRKEVKKFLKEGIVTVNNQVVKKPIQVDINQDSIKVGGETVNYKEYFYFMLNKPQGYITATKSENHSTVMDLLYEVPVSDKLFPIGRLDIDTEGLLIITNDGQLSHRLTHPKWNIEKEYFAVVDGILDKDISVYSKEGIVLEDGYKTKPFSIKIDRYKDNKSYIYITVKEGKYHIVKKIMKKLGFPVLYLKRVRIGNLSLDENLNPGEYRELTKEEIFLLKKLVKLT